MKRKRNLDIHDSGAPFQNTNSVQDRRGWSPRSRINNLSDTTSEGSDYDSLFDASEDELVPVSQTTPDNGQPIQQKYPAQRKAPLVPGLYFNPTILIPTDIAEELWTNCTDMFFTDKNVNQVMLFERARKPKSETLNMSPNNAAKEIYIDTSESIMGKGLPSFLLELLGTLKDLLKGDVPSDVYELLFPLDDESGQARQVILNHYRPGEGITPHVDLLGRYGDGIIGVSLNSGTVMDFTEVTSSPGELICDSTVKGQSLLAIKKETTPMDDSTLQRDMVKPFLNHNPEPEPICHSVYLPERSIIVLSGDSRYNWTHGIPKRAEDLVQSLDRNITECLPRGERLSITFRWLLPGADIVGG